MSKLLYFLVLKPLSLLPFRLLYLLSDVFYVVIYYLIGYRKKVVFKNLKQSFPQKNEKEIEQIAQAFYAHFCDLVLETIKMFSISKSELDRRCRWTMPQQFNSYFEQGKNIVFGCGHYGNWEMGGVALSALSPLHILCIYHPLSNSFFNRKIKSSRERFGVRLVAKENLKIAIKEHFQRPSALAFGTDQSPTSRSKKLFWTRFLNQDTAVNFGLEKYAVEHDAPVFFMKIKKIKRGFYEYHFELITDTPKDLPYGEITRLHTLALEEQILEKPQYWLWTHKRWKRKK